MGDSLSKEVLVFLVLAILAVSYVVLDSSAGLFNGSITGNAVDASAYLIKYGDQLAIKGSHGQYLECSQNKMVPPYFYSISTAGEGFVGNVIASKNVFTIEGGKYGEPIPWNSPIILRSLIGKSFYVTGETEAGGTFTMKSTTFHPYIPFSLSCQTAAVNGWEKFKLSPLKGVKVKYGKALSYGDKFALRTAHGKYVSAEPSGIVVGNRDKVAEWETFSIDKVNW